MKELKEFTVERLEYMIKSISEGNLENSPTFGEISALAKIALAAKKAEPVGYAVNNVFFRQHMTASLYSCEIQEPIEIFYTTPPLNHNEHHLDMVKLLRNLVDVVWSEAKESDEVPSTKWADELIAKVYPAAAPKPEM